MSTEMLQRGDLTGYIVAGLPKSFLAKLRKLAEAERENVEVIQLDEEMTEWLVAQLAGEKRRPHERTPASAALWRAYRALSAARYHLQDRPEEDQVRELRRLVEDLWRGLSPQFAKEEGETAEGETAGEADDKEEEKEK
ncbi:MAG TPA: hypothetical protein VMN39_05545 [Longimicrobiaceae bacterium]|nr:hypothetical protein [Longimicrobiaceae bacterium]